MIDLRQGDCLELMKDIPDKSIDMILCDLPYGTTACKWDTVIPFEPLWEQYNRVIKDNGAIVLFGSEPFSSRLRMSNLKMYRYDWIWVKNKPSGHLEAKNKPMKKCEIIHIFSKGKCSNGCLNRMVYNPQGLIEVNRTYKNSTQSNIWGTRKGREKGTTYCQKYTNYPSNVLFYGLDNKKIHSTQKPVALLEYLIKTYTNENEIVLDNCMGSGSTGVACVNTNRNFIGIELDKNYFNIAKERINNTVRKSKENKYE